MPAPRAAPAPARKRRTPDPPGATSLVETARVAGLQYVADTAPGITRKRVGRGFTYVGPDGAPVRHPDDLRRIKTLAIPPAWTGVWICPSPRGHVQATGRDARGRKQYRYNPRWTAVRDETKYERMLAFGEALPAIRARVESDLALPGLPREKVLAAVVRLLETTLIRVGNEEYARNNHSFGLTTLRDQHATIYGASVRFRFRGKAGKPHVVEVGDRRLARVVKRCQDLPGQELFQYIDDAGQHHAIGSTDVNEYLRLVSGHEFTAKDFRTWSGTVLAAWALREFEAFDSQAQARRNLVRAVEAVAERLGNTPAICRKCYVHPEVFNAYLDGSLIRHLRDRVDHELRSLADLPPEEAAVLAFLRHRLTHAVA
jgi:DNA topoisomerase-1